MSVMTPFLTFQLYSSPAIYEPYVNSSSPAVDEWTLSLAMAADTANGGLNQLETHYQTFIVGCPALAVAISF
jgi:glucan 1,3-beta-glucosidase